MFIYNKTIIPLIIHFRIDRVSFHIPLLEKKLQCGRSIVGDGTTHVSKRWSRDQANQGQNTVVT